MSELTDSLKEFDLNDKNLSSFFEEVATDLDNLNKKSPDKLDETCYSGISKAAEILKDKSSEFKLGKENHEDLLFFWKFYGGKEYEKNKKILYANRLLILSKKLAIAKNSPGDKIEKLARICLKLSEETGKYWNKHNPN